MDAYYKNNLNLFIDIGGGLSNPLWKLRMPTWSDTTRPSTAKEGDYGYNIESNQMEIYDGLDWYKIGSTII
jgi:hypothetical protein